MSDIPESLALGSAFAIGGESGPLLAALIALQNLPEGFNAYRELIESRTFTSGHIIAAFSALSLLGPAAALTGYFWLPDYPVIVSCIMVFSAGGILTCAELPKRLMWTGPRAANCSLRSHGTFVRYINFKRTSSPATNEMQYL